MPHHQNIWAPWRIDYVRGLGPGDPKPAAEDSACFLCEAMEAELDEAGLDDRLVLERNAHGTLLLNRYPYTNGHLLAAPREHVSDLSDMSAEQRAGLMELVELGNRLLKATMNPQGVNIGLNLGRVAGAGLPGHAHMHIVPRWNGDVTFMDVVAGVRVIPQALQESHRWLKEALAKGV